MTRPVMANERRLHSAKFVIFEKKILRCNITTIIEMRLVLLGLTEINSLRTTDIYNWVCMYHLLQYLNLCVVYLGIMYDSQKGDYFCIQQ